MARDRDNRDRRDRGDRMDRDDRDDREERGGGRGRRSSGAGPHPRPSRRRRGRRSEYCPEGKCFDYKDVATLERYVNEVGKIKPRRQTGNCARCQRELAREVKRARFIGLLPFISNAD